MSTPFVFDGNYKNREQVRPYMASFNERHDAVTAAGQYTYNDSFKGRIPGLAESEHEDTGIYLCQNLRRLDEDAVRESEFIAAGGRLLEQVEPGKYARIVHAGWGAYLSTRSQWCELGESTCYRHNGHDGDCTNASLGVGHVWTNTLCPAYRTAEPSDCICETT